VRNRGALFLLFFFFLFFFLLCALWILCLPLRAGLFLGVDSLAHQCPFQFRLSLAVSPYHFLLLHRKFASTSFVRVFLLFFLLLCLAPGRFIFPLFAPRWSQRNALSIGTSFSLDRPFYWLPLPPPRPLFLQPLLPRWESFGHPSFLRGRADKKIPLSVLTIPVMAFFQSKTLPLFFCVLLIIPPLLLREL